MQRVFAFATVFFVLAGGFSMIPTSASANAAPVSTIDDLNLRAEPALNATILDVMPAGAGVEITGDPANGYYPVVYNGQSGWAYSAYLTIGFTGNGPVTTGGQQGEVYVADGPVNFRTGPSTGDGIMMVIPDGALVALNGDSANGFLSIIYADTSGWAHEASILGTGEAPAPAPAEPTVPDSVPVGDAVTGTATVIDGALNLRVGPGLDYAVALVMPDGAAVELRGEPQNNFYPVNYAGTTGWAYVDFLAIGGVDVPPAPDPVPAPAPEVPAGPDAVPVGDAVTGTAMVIDGALNLRTGPSLDHPVVLVMPDAASVELRGSAQNNFSPVSYNGTTGWAYADFLQVGTAEEPEGPPAPAPEPPAEPETPVAPPVDGSDGYTEEEIIQIIYAAADEYGQPREDMLRVARCESVLDPNAVNATSQASGLFQFLPSTWQRTPWAAQDVFDPVANAYAAAWMWDQGNRGEWVCQ